jgi:hypothetical protein
MTTTNATRLVRITWVDADGNAACIGLDETIRSGWTLDECRKAAIYHARCEGVDLGRYHVEIEEV